MGLYSNKIVEEDLNEILNSDLDWEKLNHKSILITGATGMIASYITFVLAKLNLDLGLSIQIYALGRNKEKAQNKFSDFFDKDFFHFIYQDIELPLNLNQNIDYIIHAASNASPKYMLDNPVDIAKANLLGTFNVLEFSKKNHVKMVHFLSTREIYGAQPQETSFISEDDFGALSSVDLRSVYPETKRAAETLLVAYAKQFNIPFTISRIAHSYGPGMAIENDGRIMSDLIGNIVNKKDVLLKSKGLADRAFIYITDTVRGIFTILLNGENKQAYNLANETEPIKIRDLATMLIQLFPALNLNVVYSLANSTDQTGYVKFKRVGLDTSKLENIGWQPKIALRKGLKQTINSFWQKGDQVD